MSSAVSSSVVLLIFLGVLAPAALAFFRGDIGHYTGCFYVVLGMLALSYHVGFAVDRPSLVAPPANASLEKGPCDQALAAAYRGGLVLDRSDPDRLVVSRNQWRGVPPAMRAALVKCAAIVRPANLKGTPVEIVEQAGGTQ